MAPPAQCKACSPQHCRQGRRRRGCRARRQRRPPRCCIRSEREHLSLWAAFSGFHVDPALGGVAARQGHEGDHRTAVPQLGLLGNTFLSIVLMWLYRLNLLTSLVVLAGGGGEAAGLAAVGGLA